MNLRCSHCQSESTAFAMRPDTKMDKVLNCEKQIKSKLVKTRRIIQKKFEKARKDRVNRDLKLKDKYKPITTVLDKIVGKNTKSEVVPSTKAKNESIRDFSVYGPPNNRGNSSAYGRHDYSDDVGEESEPEYYWDDEQYLEEMEVEDVPEEIAIPNIQIPTAARRSARIASRRESDGAISMSSILGERSAARIGKRRATDALPRKSKDIVPNELHRDIMAYDKHGKRLRLSKSEMAALDRKMREHALKQRDIQRARRIRDEVDEKNADENDRKKMEFVEISSEEEDDESDGEPVEIPDRNPAVKRPVTRQKTKYVRTEPTPVDQRKRSLVNYKVGVKKINFTPKTHTRPGQATAASSAALDPQPFIESPYLSKPEILYRAAVRPGPSNEPTLPPKKKGSKKKKGGNIETNFIPYNENIAYEFYDNPNELCDRLRLLLASRAAGNSNHSQEINSLIAELRESRYIH